MNSPHPTPASPNRSLQKSGLQSHHLAQLFFSDSDSSFETTISISNLSVKFDSTRLVLDDAPLSLLLVTSFSTLEAFQAVASLFCHKKNARRQSTEQTTNIINSVVVTTPPSCLATVLPSTSLALATELAPATLHTNSSGTSSNFGDDSIVRFGSGPRCPPSPPSLRISPRRRCPRPRCVSYFYLPHASSLSAMYPAHLHSGPLEAPPIAPSSPFLDRAVGDDIFSFDRVVGQTRGGALRVR